MLPVTPRRREGEEPFKGSEIPVEFVALFRCRVFGIFLVDGDIGLNCLGRLPRIPSRGSQGLFVVTASGSKGFLVLLLRNDGCGTGQDRKRLSEDLGETDGGLLVVGPSPPQEHVPSIIWRVRLAAAMTRRYRLSMTSSA
jgi:hypothetical protein